VGVLDSINDNLIKSRILASFVDCEATSFNGHCTEIGFAQVWLGRPLTQSPATVAAHPDFPSIFIRSNSSLVRVDRWMDDYLKWDPAAEKITGISRAMVLEQGKPAQEVALWLNAELSGLTTYSDAKRHDSNWIDQVFKVAGLKRGFKISQVERLTLRCDIDKAEFRAHCDRQFDTLHGEEKPHRAEADAISWAHVFAKCWRDVAPKKWSLAKLFGF